MIVDWDLAKETEYLTDAIHRQKSVAFPHRLQMDQSGIWEALELPHEGPLAEMSKSCDSTRDAPGNS